VCLRNLGWCHLRLCGEERETERLGNDRELFGPSKNKQNSNLHLARWKSKIRHLKNLDLNLGAMKIDLGPGTLTASNSEIAEFTLKPFFYDYAHSCLSPEAGLVSSCLL